METIAKQKMGWNKVLQATAVLFLKIIFAE
jgi:hypothetical protein